MTNAETSDLTSDNKSCDNKSHEAKQQTTYSTFDNTVVIGAGVSGLLTAWSLAHRGITVTLLDKSAPLAGASGNPRALLAPKMTPIHHVDEHLHTIGYLHSSRLYQDLNQTAVQLNTAPVLELIGALDLLIKANIGTEQIADYPDEMATTLSHEQAQILVA
ncbi:FAD-dependent oxidoreductase [Psychrobacter sp. JCM 18901]|uniref:FAD-dependent oxidoreductase n=1 Tax=Psychrobacter sp. JCM 18901 TaxID=1298609 RepID=UPI00351C9837